MKYIGKKVWFDSVLWKIKDIFRPTPYDIYILVQRKKENLIHEKGVIPIDMFLIDGNNDDFCFDNPEISKIMAQRKKDRTKCNRKQEKIDKLLNIMNK